MFEALPIPLPGTDAQTVDVEYIALKQQGPCRERKRDYGSETSSSSTESSKPGAKREKVLEARSRKRLKTYLDEIMESASTSLSFSER